MATRHTTDHRTRWTADVALRIPRDGGADLETDARRRLQRVESVERVEVRELRGIEPALAATVAQFEVAVVVATAHDEHRLRQLLASASGTERVDGVELE
jgi:hypothetical protein